MITNSVKKLLIVRHILLVSTLFSKCTENSVENINVTSHAKTFLTVSVQTVERTVCERMTNR